MDKIKEIFTNKKLLFTIIGGIVTLLVLIFVIFFIIKMMNRKLSYSALEDKLVSATENYLKDHSEYYPTSEVPLFTLNDQTLVTEKYLKKDISKLMKEQCSAEIEVRYENKSYRITPFLTCDKYETSLFYDKILSNNPVTDINDGLYDMNDMLVFRGDSLNNFVKFKNLTWRIVKMDPSNSNIYLILENMKDAPYDIWDNRYNTAEESKHGINDYGVSIAFNTLNDIYSNSFTEKEKAFMKPMSVCIGKRSETENVNNGSVECSYIMNEPQYISLMPLYDYINASTDYQCRSVEDRACSNYNYLVNKVGKWWTLTADGSRGTRVYSINYAGVISSDNADSKRYLRYMIAIDGNSIYKEGNGSAENPYVMK